MTNTDRSTDANATKRVAILGGGPAAMTAAYWLTDPEQKNAYEVTVYCQGWRLGGKCASGRNMQQAAGIEEHGLHILMGCYENGFATMRSCYDEWRKLVPDPGNMLQTWQDAFIPQRRVTLMALDGPGSPPTWSPWSFNFIKTPGEPGDGPLVPGSTMTAMTPLEELLVKMSHLLLDAIAGEHEGPHGGAFPVQIQPPYYQQTHEAITAMQAMFTSNAPDPDKVAEKLRKATEAIQPNLLLEPPPHPPGADFAVETDETAKQFFKRLAILADLGVAFFLGYVKDIFAQGEAGFEAINELDLREWLGKHGASEKALDSAPLRAWYDLTFAAVDGDPASKGNIAAGVSFRTMLEMVVGYANAPMWKMTAGMGDVVFTPLYQTLLARGVKFEFFRRVVNLKTDGTQLDEIVLMNQAETVSGDPYQPLNRITCMNGKQLEVWPNQPDWGQLKDGAELEAKGVDFEYSGCIVTAGPPITLTAGEDFDIAISGIPPLALQPIASDLQTALPQWQAALSASVSVATQSLQLWMKPDVESLGWGGGDTILTSYAQPYDSWGNMSQVIEAETWTAETAPGSIGYFCGTLHIPNEGVSLPAMTAIAFDAASDWMDAHLPTLWPNLAGTPSKSGDMIARYSRANFDLPEQYVQTPAGANVGSRLNPGKPAGLPNLYAVGDWTRTRFSGGCFESAVESGMLASRGISGFPQDIETLSSL